MVAVSLLFSNPFFPSVPTFAVREIDVSRHNGGTSGAPLKSPRDDGALKALSSLRGLRGAPEVPPLCRESSVSRTANVGTEGKNGLSQPYILYEIENQEKIYRQGKGFLLLCQIDYKKWFNIIIFLLLLNQLEFKLVR